MAQFSWPSLTVSASNPAVGPTGITAPASATEVGGVDPSGNLQAVQVTAAKALIVDGSGVTQPVSAAALPLPAGASTSALQSTGNTSLGSIDTKTPDLVSGRVPVDGSGVTQPVSAAALPLPAGAATSALQTTGNTSLSSIDGKLTTTANGIKVDNSGNTQPVSAAALPLPTGAATSALQTTGNTSLSSLDGKLPTQGQKASAGSLPVVLASDQPSLPVVQGARTVANAPVYNDYTATSVSTSAYTQVVASTSNAIKQIDVFDSSGQAMILATGGAGSEVIIAYVPPGGGTIPVGVGAGTRLSLKALTASATSGYVLANFWS